MNTSVQMKTIEKNENNNLVIFMLFAIAFMMVAPAYAGGAGATGAAFQSFYNFVIDAANGFLGRGICITGGLIGLGYGALGGKPIMAGMGILLAVFGTLAPQIVNTLFTSAVI
ncbi:hypothetical protein [Algicola sagamiensis]|uniref:hypothetical protein n=1 Tax=Algicola sagamiensis TaxID=163869 RepID=UPI00037EC918|nr:hypothetical protein [Algicola sagamiensis]